MSNSPITDVIFDFCGVLLDWQTRACLTGHFPQDTVDAICAPDDPHGFFRYEDRMDAGEDFSHIYPDVVREQGEDIAPIFAYYIEHYGDALPRMLPGMEDLLRDLKRHGYGVWGLTNWSHETIHIACREIPADWRTAAGHRGLRHREDAQAERRHLRARTATIRP